MNDATRILVVEDDPDIAELISVTVSKEGWQAVVADRGEKALALIAEEDFSACVLDLMLPGMDGLAVLRKLRASAKGAGLALLIASARGEDSDIVAGLELGADDYVPKPFSPKVLVARLRALLRRAQAPAAVQDGAAAAFSELLHVSGIVLDTRRHEVRAQDRPIDLSATEFAILELFMREPGRVFTRAQAIGLIKGHDYPVTDRALDVHILALRRKLGDAAPLIETVRGIGYRFKEDL